MQQFVKERGRSSESFGIPGTTAGWKSSFAYDKLIELVIKMVIEPDEAFVVGGTWRVPVLEGLLPKSFVSDLKISGTYNESSFSREYRQICTLKTIENCWKTLRGLLATA